MSLKFINIRLFVHEVFKSNDFILFLIQYTVEMKKKTKMRGREKNLQLVA